MKPVHHAEINSFSSRDNCLLVGGIPITQLAMRVGSTPFYAYDRQLILKRIHYLREVLPDSLKLHYAMKANPMPAVVDFMAQQVDGLDVASAGEMAVALDSGMPTDLISFAGPGKQVSEIRQALAAGIVINVESENELEIIKTLSQDTGYAANICLRVNPDFELKKSGMKMGGGPKQFGIDASRIPDVLAYLDANHLPLHGLHIFWGSQNLNSEAIQEAQSQTINLAIRLLKNRKTPAKSINIGGGFGIPYFPGEAPLNLKPVGENLNKLMDKVKQELGNIEIEIELGRYLVGEAGIYVSRVIDRKVSQGETFLITDGGLHHHLSASGNFGQVIRKNYPVVIGNRLEGNLETVSVVGPLCTPLDLLANKMELPQAEIGDLVVILQSGAYGYTASPHLFLSHPEPKQVLV